MFTTTSASTTAVCRVKIYTHDDGPNSVAVEAQIAELAAAHELTVEVVDVTCDPSIAIAAGVVGLPAIVVHAGADELTRRECAAAGRRLSRWFHRKVATATPALVLAPAFA